MAQVVIAAPADADIGTILAYLGVVAGRETARRYLALFESLYDRLAEHPASLPRRPALGLHIRIGVVSPYIVIYHHDARADTVTVLRIVHGRRRISGQMLAAAR